MITKYKSTQVSEASLSNTQIAKNIHEELAQTIATWKNMVKNAFSSDIHSQLANTIKAHAQVMDQYNSTMSPAISRQHMENKQMVAL